MNQFLVKVACLAHLSACPIPNGYKATISIDSKDKCERAARTVIASYGYKSSDFAISCQEKH